MTTRTLALGRQLFVVIKTVWVKSFVLTRRTNQQIGPSLKFLYLQPLGLCGDELFSMLVTVMAVMLYAARTAKVIHEATVSKRVD